MRVLRTILFVGTVLSVTLSFEISDQGCQCLDDCRAGRSILSPLTKFCKVDVSVCTDAEDKKDREDKCGHLFDTITEWANWMGDKGQNMYNKLEGWTKENIQAIKVDDIKAWTKEQWAKMPVDQIRNFSKQQIAAIDVGKLIDLDEIGDIASKWGDMTKEQIDKIGSVAKEKWPQVVQKMSFEEAAQIPKDIMNTLPLNKANAIKEKLHKLNWQEAAKFADEVWDSVPVDNIVEMGVGAIQTIPYQSIGKWTAEQWEKIPVDKLIHFTGDQIGKIDPAKLANLGGEYWDKVPVYQIVKIKIGLLQAAGFDIAKGLDAEKIAQMTEEQWKEFPVEDILKFSAEQLKAIDYHALGNWAKTQWDQIPFEKIAAFAGEQIRNIDPQVLAAWSKEQWDKFPASKAVMLTKEQLEAAAGTLKELGEEKLKEFDWEALKQIELPAELKTKLEAASHQVQQALKTKTEKVTQLVQKKKDLYLEWQEKKNTPGISEPQVAQLEAAYTAAKLEAEVQQAELISMQVDADASYDLGEKGAAEGSGVATHVPSAAVLGAAILLASVLM